MAPVKTPRRPSKHLFYEQVLTEAERAGFEDALQVAGIDEEIAALRLRLRTAFADSEHDMTVLLRGLDVLRRLVATKYGLSKEDRGSLDTAFAQAVQRLLAEERGKGGERHDGP